MEPYLVIVLFIILLANVGLAFIPASMAKKKGYSYGGFWCLSFFVSFLVGVIVAACITDKNQAAPAAGLTPQTCPKCNAQIPPDMQFCTVCGTPLPTPAAVYAQPMQPILEPPAKSSFANSYLSFIIFGFVFLVILALGAATRNFFAFKNIQNIFIQLVIIIPIAMATTLTTRAKGPDLSIGAVMGLAGVVFALNTTSLSPAIIATFLICVIIGAANGALTVFLRIPAVITTLVMSFIVRGLAYVATQGKPIPGQIPMLAQANIGGLSIGLITIVPFVFIVAFVLILLTKLGKPQYKRVPSDNRNLGFFFAYIASALLAGIAGVFLMSRINMANPTIGTGYEMLVLFVFAVITSSRAADNKFIPAVYAIGAALVWVFMNNIFNLIGLSSYLHTIIQGILVLGFLVLSYIARRDFFKRLVQFE